MNGGLIFLILPIGFDGWWLCHWCGVNCAGMKHVMARWLGRGWRLRGALYAQTRLVYALAPCMYVEPTRNNHPLHSLQLMGQTVARSFWILSKVLWTLGRFGIYRLCGSSEQGFGCTDCFTRSRSTPISDTNYHGPRTVKEGERHTMYHLALLTRRSQCRFCDPVPGWDVHVAATSSIPSSGDCYSTSYKF